MLSLHTNVKTISEYSLNINSLTGGTDVGLRGKSQQMLRGKAYTSGPSISKEQIQNWQLYLCLGHGIAEEETGLTDGDRPACLTEAGLRKIQAYQKVGY